MLRMPAPPAVTVAIPLYNGASYLAEAIESVLAQTFRDLELVISDDASTDQSAGIAERYAKQDARIRFFPNSENLGLGRNYNRALSFARGTYFMWLAQDDIILPEYIEKCVAMLESSSDIMLTNSSVLIQHGDQRHVYAGLALHTCERPSERFGMVVLRAHWNVELFSLIRRAALLQTKGRQHYYGSDRALIAHLALLGKFGKIEEFLFVNRDHDKRAMRRYSFVARLWLHDPSRTSRPMPPQWSAYKDYWRALREADLPAEERRRCQWILIKWWCVNWNLLRVAVDILAATTPALVEPLSRWRVRYYHRGAIGVRPVRTRRRFLHRLR